DGGGDRQPRVPDACAQAPPRPRRQPRGHAEAPGREGRARAVRRGGGMSYPLMGEALACCRRTTATPPGRSVLLALATSTTARTGRCDPSIATLCALTGYGRATAQRALDQLKGCGAVTVTRRRRQTSQYVLHPTALEVSRRDFKGESLKSHR